MMILGYWHFRALRWLNQFTWVFLCSEAVVWVWVWVSPRGTTRWRPSPACPGAPLPARSVRAAGRGGAAARGRRAQPGGLRVRERGRRARAASAPGAAAAFPPCLLLCSGPALRSCSPHAALILTLTAASSSSR